LCDSPEVQALKGHLEEMERFFVGTNYFAKFEAHVFKIEVPFLPLADVVLLAYPEAKPKQAATRQVSVEDMVEYLDSCLSLRFCTSAREQAAIEERERWMRGEFWLRLEACVNYSGAEIVSYNGTDGLPGYWVFWNFALLIHNIEQQRCVLLFGYSCD